MIDIHKNLQEVEEQIAAARKRSVTGEEVTLIAVTKTHDVPVVEQAIGYGIQHIGENKVQELEKKIAALDEKVFYHMIGSLQSNKVKYIYDKVELIHSLDRMSLVKEIEKRGAESKIQVPCLIQINIGKESSKGGIAIENTYSFLEDVLAYPHVKIKGLMAMAPNTDDEKVLRQYFRDMFTLKEDIIKRNYKEVDMDYLSMGMSQDFTIAIEEGSNMVRVGSRIFGKRDYSK